MAPKATPSFPHPVSLPKDLPKSNLSASGPYADFTQTGTVVIISQPPGQSCAVMGGIMAARMKVSGAQGIVINGRVRDLVALAETGLPIWSKGTSIVGAGAETSFHAREVPVQVGETVVEPGDIVMIDPFENGVVAVPQSKVEEVLQLLPKLVGADEKVISDVKNGRTVDEAFKKHRTTMGITDFFSDVWETFSYPSPDAEAPPQGGSSTESPASGTNEESNAEKEINEEDAKDEGEGEQGHKPSGGDDDEDDEEEEEPQDPKDILEKECAESKACHGPKHHYDECVERVTGQIENDGKASEDCVEEFFHLAHCATQCAAPKLFAQLK
ncbi:DlpA domain-containing protein [Paraphaeosphaeria minitans]|uniref:DlpA domain-containing protein n=1 Tax=Paraphaeosphaeria minitans TaxID=565426 RepID=A0A9P6GWL9_9PLEO|nr:DlpA domain-containing protein [Paraphaeosphaeria minitans]